MRFFQDTSSRERAFEKATNIVEAFTMMPDAVFILYPAWKCYRIFKEIKQKNIEIKRLKESTEFYEQLCKRLDSVRADLRSDTA